MKYIYIYIYIYMKYERFGLVWFGFIAYYPL